MAWHVGPPREFITGVAVPEMRAWHKILKEEAADSLLRWRLDAYIDNVSAPVTIADTFIDEWLEGLWRIPLK